MIDRSSREGSRRGVGLVCEGRGSGRERAHTKGGFYDGRFATLRDVVNHYNAHFGLLRTEREKGDLIEYLKSLKQESSAVIKLHRSSQRGTVKSGGCPSGLTGTKVGGTF
jgi:hypothetical protein